MSGLWGPVEVALAKATETIPAPTALPGRTRYEMKWDGFRIAVVRTEDHTALWSRQGSRLDNQFPDLLAAAADQLPPGVVLDGEGVIWSADRLDFSALLSRMSSSATSARRLASQQPASFVAFDVLAVAGHDVRDQSFAQRRALLEELAQSMRPPLQTEPGLADHPARGLDGVGHRISP